MKYKAITGMVLILLFVGMPPLVFNIQPAKASGTIYIRADGSIDPLTANITSVDNVTYTFTGNINESIVIERDNIVIDGAGYTLQGPGSGTGIYLSGRTNVTVRNTQIKVFYYAIELWSSSGNSISGNDITNNYYAIELQSSSGNSISGNNIANNKYGVLLHYSSGNSISENTFTRDGLFVHDSYGNVVENNIVNGKPLVYLEGVSHLNVGEAGQVILLNCEYIQVQNLNLSYTDVALQLWKTNNALISGNHLTNNTDMGILLVSSSGNSISGNDITNNWHGVLLHYVSNYNSISGNNITNNHIGIWLDSSSSNSAYHNNFVGNIEQVDMYGGYHLWDDGYPYGGNYWSDYVGTDFYSGVYQNITGSDGIGDTPYVINVNNRDNYPLMNPWTPIQTSVNVNGKNNPVTIVSNTTIDQMVVTANALHFKSSGSEGEKGYINVIFPMVNTTEIKVFIDGMRLTPPPFPVINTNGTHYFIYFEFTLSTHSIEIQFAPTPPVGGISIPVNKLELLPPYIGLTILLAAAVITVGYVKKRKRNTEINS